jgi:hypothetical protein
MEVWAVILLGLRVQGFLYFVSHLRLLQARAVTILLRFMNKIDPCQARQFPEYSASGAAQRSPRHFDNRAATPGDKDEYPRHRANP